MHTSQTNTKPLNLKPIAEYQHILAKFEQGVRAILITGKAGTGKSVLIKQLVKALPNSLITATTAMAATNIGGITLHSLFGLKPTDINPAEKINLRADKIDQIKAIKTLVIDEVSMLTANIVDIIDTILQEVHGSDKPFAGINMIFVGDLLQLPPIVIGDVKEFFKEHYQTFYFFSAKVFQQLPLYSIELTKVRRQQDQKFIELLNSIRTKNPDHFQAIKYINDICYLSNKTADKHQLHLVTTNKKAAEINNNKLAELKDDSMDFRCDIEGDITTKDLGFAELLTLKKHAKVIFTKNTEDFYNGEQGEVVDFSTTSYGDTFVKVKKATDNKLIKVYRQTWEQYKPVYDKKQKKFTQEFLGSVSQFPLILGWAITVHKSQGMSLDNVVIDTKPSFTNGLVYVALSRCRTLQGISLLSKLSSNDIRIDYNLLNWYQQNVTFLLVNNNLATTEF